MTALLASVRDPGEARQAAAAGVDLVDFKNPSRGALGALPPALVCEARRALPSGTPTSATAGDLPLHPERLRGAVMDTAASGVDYVKIGLIAGPGQAGCAAALRSCCVAGVRVIVVLFADQRPNFGLLPVIADAGCRGVMLDTAGKRSGSLREHLSPAQLADFVGRARALGLLCGLAGSLGFDDVAPLCRLGPDYLGFRGALCRGGRDGRLDDVRLGELRALLPRRPAPAAVGAGG